MTAVGGLTSPRFEGLVATNDYSLCPVMLCCHMLLGHQSVTDLKLRGCGDQRLWTCTFRVLLPCPMPLSWWLPQVGHPRWWPWILHSICPNTWQCVMNAHLSGVSVLVWVTLLCLLRCLSVSLVLLRWGFRFSLQLGLQTFPACPADVHPVSQKCCAGFLVEQLPAPLHGTLLACWPHAFHWCWPFLSLASHLCWLLLVCSVIDVATASCSQLQGLLLCEMFALAQVLSHSEAGRLFLLTTLLPGFYMVLGHGCH